MARSPRQGDHESDRCKSTRRPEQWAALFSFPNPVNEVSARPGGRRSRRDVPRSPSACNLKWATAVIAYGFVARVLTGTTLSPLGQLMTRVVTPRLHAGGTSGGWTAQALRPGHRRRLLGHGARADHPRLLGRRPDRARLSLAMAAFLESAFGLCLGCKAFAVLMRFGVVPEEVCERCNNIWATSATA